MTTSIASVVTALQTVNAAITGITTAPTVYPPSLNTAQLPAAIVWPAEADDMLEGLGYNVEQRTYRITVYALPIEQGKGIDQGLQAATTLLERFITAYLSSTNNPVLNENGYQASIRNSRDNPIRDTGLDILAYPPPATGVAGYPHFYGFELSVTIKTEYTGS